MFSLRNIITRVVNDGKRALFNPTHVHSRYSNIIKLTESSAKESGRRLCYDNCQRIKSVSSPSIANSTASGSTGRLLQYLGPVTRRFLKGIVNKVPSPLWISARKKTVQRLFGETAPYFALVGVTLVSGSDRGLLTEKDQLEALCGDIREAISRSGWIHDPNFWAAKATCSDRKRPFSLADLELGPVIDKGCNAVVYSAKWKQSERLENETSPLEPNAWNAKLLSTRITEALNLDGIDLIKSIHGLPLAQPQHHSVGANIDLLISTKFQKPNSNVKIKEHSSQTSSQDKLSTIEFPLALKMLFNYEAASNAPSILTAMKKELLPARNIQTDILPFKMKQLPQHSNVVDMMCVFVDRIPLLEGGFELYPQALPKRIHPSGFGRNMSLFCVMKRYDCTLSEYLSKFSPSMRISCLLLTQLLEAINHMTKYSVAHRDLKSDNLLLDLSEGFESPHLVVTDFGCSLSSPSMKAPFPSSEADPRLGNLALMAPEVRGSIPGLLARISFEKSDLWSAGAIAFEIFGMDNPFICDTLNSLTYKENQVPKLPSDTPSIFRHLAVGLLKRNPNHRPSARVAATVAQLAMWAPSQWLHRHSLLLPSHSEVTSWLLCLTTKVLCEAGTGPGSSGGRLEYELVSSLLNRIYYEDVLEAISWTRAYS